LLGVVLLFPAFVYAETIVLKSGKKIEGKIIEKNETYITVDFEGGTLPYFYEDIETIDGKKLALATPIDPLNPASSVNKEVVRQANSVRKLPFSTAIITYEDSGGNNKGKEVVYIDVAKNKVSRDIDLEIIMKGVVTKINTREISDGKALTRVNFIEKTTTSFPGRGGDFLSLMFNEDMFLSHYKGKRFILGKECKEYQTAEELLCFWNAILLKEEIISDRINFVKEVQSIKLDIPISQEKFEIPADMKILTPEEAVEIVRKKQQGNEEVKKEDLETIVEEMKKMREEDKNRQ